MTEFIHDELTENGQSLTQGDIIAEPEGHGDTVPDIRAVPPRRVGTCFRWSRTDVCSTARIADSTTSIPLGI